MDLSAKEIALIKAAIRAQNITKVVQPILLFCLLMGFLAQLFDMITSEEFTYLALPLMFLTIMLAKLCGSPTYHELLKILEKRLPPKPTLEAALAEALKQDK